jgi:putative transposase
MNHSKGNPTAPICFITAAVGGWKHLFANEACARIVFDSLDFQIRMRKLAVYGFVLLPSHLHLLFRPLVGDAQRWLDGFAEFTASRMTSVLRRRGRHPLMTYLHAHSGREGPGSPIWGKLQIQEVVRRDKLMSLLEYMHNKPLSAEWRLAVTRAEYLYSSACFYDLGHEPVIAVTDAREELAG